MVTAELGAVGRADGIASVRLLSEGGHADVWLISYADGSRIVGKTLTGASGDLFAIEAEGLAALRAAGQGWIDRMPILHLRELLSTVAHFGTEAGSIVQQSREILGPFY